MNFAILHGANVKVLYTTLNYPKKRETHMPFLDYSYPEQIARMMNYIYKRKMTTPSGGNLSIRDSDASLWITPTTIDKGDLKPDSIAHILADGTCAGSHKPSSEYPFHHAIYANRMDINAIVHAHPASLVSFSLVHQTPEYPIFLESIRSNEKNKRIGYVPYILPGSLELGNAIAQCFNDGFDAALLENHGIVVGATNLWEAYLWFEELEWSASIEIIARSDASYTSVHRNPLDLMEGEWGSILKKTHLKKMEKKISPQKGSTSNHDESHKKATEICYWINRMVDRETIPKSIGSFSVRLSEKSFWITPQEPTTFEWYPDQLCLVEEGICDGSLMPHRLHSWHQDLYLKFPQIGCIALVQPKYLMSFLLGSKRFHSKTIPECYMVLRDTPTIPFQEWSKQPESLLHHLSNQSPILLLEKLGILITGKDPYQTFDRLEVAESSARSIRLASTLGELKCISDQEIQKIEKAFFGM